MDVRIDQSHETQNTPIIGLMFHDVTDSPQTTGFLQPSAQRYKHSTAQFESYLQVVEDSRLPVLPSAEFRTTQTSTLFTFDDGGASAMIAADILQRRNWRGTFLVTTDLIDTPGFLTRRQIVELHQRGHVIGSHSCSHPDIFRNLNRDEKYYQWHNSCRALEDIVGEAITTASVPGGDMDTATIEEAGRTGITSLFTSEWSVTPWQHAGVTCFGRAWMLRSTTPQTLSRWLHHPRLGLLPERGVRIAKRTVKTLMAPVYRRMMTHRRAVHERS